jgi:DNA polymerase-4
LRYSDFNTFSKQTRISYTAQDTPLVTHALTVFDSLYERRQEIRLVGVRFSKLVTGASQLELFDDTEKESRLLAAMDKIRDRFGKNAVCRK